MHLYTIKSFADLLVTSTQCQKLKTREQKLLLLDKCNWFIYAIVKDNIKNNDAYGTFVNLHSEVLKKYLDNRIYKGVQLCLIGLSILIENLKY